MIGFIPEPLQLKSIGYGLANGSQTMTRMPQRTFASLLVAAALVTGCATTGPGVTPGPESRVVPFSEGTGAPPLTVSIGLTALRPGEPIDAALDRADAALYQAKRAGRNRCVDAG